MSNNDGDEPLRQGPIRQPKPLLLRYGADATRPPDQQTTVVDGICHRGSITLVYGKPKSGKSFLSTDLALAVSDPSRETWMGHRIRSHGPVLYVACEGEGGFWKRLVACGHVPDQFTLAMGRPVLLYPENKGYLFVPYPNDILAALNQVGNNFGVHPSLVMIDTVFRSFGAANVNDSSHMMQYVTAVNEITNWEIAVTLVHHANKGSGTPAGSVALMGAADTLIECVADDEERGLHSWAVEQSKDDAPTDPRQFRLEVVPYITDSFGEFTSSCRVVDLATVAPKPKRGRPPKGEDELALQYLRELLERDAIYDGFGVPSGHPACPVTKWQAAFMSRTRPDDPHETKRKAWRRARDKLQHADRVGFSGSLVWINGDSRPGHN